MHQLPSAQITALIAAGRAVRQQFCLREGDTAWTQAGELLEAGVCWMPDPKRLKIPSNCESQHEHQQHEPGHQSDSWCQQPLPGSVGLQVWSLSLWSRNTLAAVVKNNAETTPTPLFSVLHCWESLKICGSHSPYNPLWKITNTERSTEQKHGLGQHTEGKANYFCSLINLFVYWGKLYLQKHSLPKTS